MRQLLQQFLFHRQKLFINVPYLILSKAQEREHFCWFYYCASTILMKLLHLIKQSQSADEAIAKLNKRFLLSAEQGKAILEMRLQRLTGLNKKKFI